MLVRSGRCCADPLSGSAAVLSSTGRPYEASTEDVYMHMALLVEGALTGAQGDEEAAGRKEDSSAEEQIVRVCGVKGID